MRSHIKTYQGFGMRMPQLKDFDFKEKKVLVRCDLDVPIERQMANGKWQMAWVRDEERLRESLPTIEYLLQHGAKEIILMGHAGRPEGKVIEELRLAPVAQKFEELLKSKSKYPRKNFVEIQRGRQKSKTQSKNQKFIIYRITDKITLLENLRFDKREEGNDERFAKDLAKLGEFYVNEAFATSHREHASIVGVPGFLPHCAGLHFASEVENLSKVLESPKRPLVFVIGGAKPETKLPYIAKFAQVADWVLVGGLLAEEEYQKSKCKYQKYNSKLKNIVYADLVESGLDVSEDSIKKFEEIIKTAGTVVWNGPMGKYEDEKWEKGTRKIAEAVAGYGGFEGFAVVGGGDTISVLTKFNLVDKMDYVSTGGGAMLEFLAKGTLPGIEVLL